MQEKLLIGTDEAGYGPNLGPLVITATAWRVPADLDCEDLWQQFARVLTNQPGPDDRRLFVADSKEVYSPASGLVDLETGVLSFLTALGLDADSVQSLGGALAGPDFLQALAQEPLVDTADCVLPVEAFADEVHDFRRALQAAFQDAGIQLEQVRSRVVFPAEFNELVAAADSKGVVLSSCTLQLVREVCPPWLLESGRSAGSVQVICDKHGGRNRYDEVIAETFGDQFVFRLQESAARSRYRMGSAEFCFQTKAEQFLPVALASMVSKYLREVLMMAFNSFWQQQIPDLKPTKGYPLDARRFREQIAETARQLGICEARFWRNR